MFLFMFYTLQGFESWMRNWLIFKMAQEHKADSGYYNIFFFLMFWSRLVYGSLSFSYCDVNP